MLSKEMASCHIVASLEKSRELCTGSEEVADFKLILEKAESDGHIDRGQMLCLDNKAERHAVFNEQCFLKLMEAIKSNTARIEGLEANVEAINNSVNAIRKGLKHKMKVDQWRAFLVLPSMQYLSGWGEYCDCNSLSIGFHCGLW